MPRHDQVRVPGEVQPVGREAAALEVVELVAEAAGIDDAAGADHAVLSGQDPGRQVPQLVRLLADEDRVARVRPAVVTANDVRVLGEQVDDLALALVSPLRPDDHGRGHGMQCATAAGGIRR